MTRLEKMPDPLKNTPGKTLAVSGLLTGYNSGNKTISVGSVYEFELFEGELVAIVGANGTGKSTLMRTLCGLQPPLQGSILLCDKPLHTYHPTHLAQVLSVVLTESPASVHLTGLELIALGRHPHTNWLGSLEHHDKERIEEIIGYMHLDNLIMQRCGEMSDGQLQRVLIARALVQDTPIMLLDEPTTHLDLYHKARILRLLKDIAHRNGKTVVFSSHEIDLAIQLCDKMLLLTEDENFYGEPCQLIAEGQFSRIFPDDIIRFDASTGSFKMT